MTKSVTFYFSLLSPWVYLGAPRFHSIVASTGASVQYRPIDLLKVFRDTGGTPLGQLHPSRQAYRALERERWSALLGMPLNAKPRFHPADESLAARMLIAMEPVAPSSLWPLANAMLRAVWVRDLNIADTGTLVGLARELDLDGDALLQRALAPEILTAYEANSAQAIAAGIFGVPSFVIGDDLYFGQDRLGFVERALRN